MYIRWDIDTITRVLQINKNNFKHEMKQCIERGHIKFDRIDLNRIQTLVKIIQNEE